MAQLSRTKKYQDLRDKLEEETTEAQVQTSPSRLSRVQASKLSHASLYILMKKLMLNQSQKNYLNLQSWMIF